MFGWKFNGLWNGYIASVHLDIAGGAQKVKFSALEIKSNNRSRLGWGAGTEYCLFGRDAQVPNFAEGSFNLLKIAGSAVKDGQVPDPLAGISTNDAICGVESIGRHGKQPLRSAELAIPRTDKLYLIAAGAVQVPPLVSIGDEIKLTI